jgi:hypothetical protein
LIGANRSSVPIYGSGGFAYEERQFERELGGWVEKEDTPGSK